MEIVKITNGKVLEKKTVLPNYEFGIDEILDDGTYGNVGDILLDGVWQKDPAEIELQAKQTRLSELTNEIQEAKLLDDPYIHLIDEYKAIKAELAQ